jgi:hypothetical protein
MNGRQILYVALLAPFLALTSYVLATQGMVGFYEDALRTPATVLMGLDLTISLGLVLAWMWTDARATGTPFAPYLIVTLAIGVAGPLLYLIHREAGRRRAAVSRATG